MNSAYCDKHADPARGDVMANPGPHTPGIPPDAVARFTAAEARLYPLVIVDPEAYERAVTLTGLLLTDMRSTCPDVDAVLRRREALLRLLTEPTDEARPSIVGLNPETLVDAASALRCRELQAELGAGVAAAGDGWPDPAP
ncbi:MAG: hypothetical protein ACRDVN_00160 [Jiangellaceae bacterium]